MYARTAIYSVVVMGDLHVKAGHSPRGGEEGGSVDMTADA